MRPIFLHQAAAWFSAFCCFVILATMTVLAWAQTIAPPTAVSGDPSFIPAALGWVCSNQSTVIWILGIIVPASALSGLASLTKKTPAWLQTVLHFLSGDVVSAFLAAAKKVPPTIADTAAKAPPVVLLLILQPLTLLLLIHGHHSRAASMAEE